MNQPKKYILLPATLLLGTSLLFGGCTAAKKPMAPAKTPPTQNEKATPNNNTKTGQNHYPKEAADRVVREANKTQGVQGSTAVISGKNIYVGLDLKSNLEKASSARVENDALARVKKIEPTYTVHVTSDIDTVTRIKRVGQGISQGKPISSFTKEIEDIGTRIKPRTK